MELRKIILQHDDNYPRWQAADLVKLIYQNEFGPGHFISDPEASLARLKGEINSLPAAAEESQNLWEDLGGGFSRLYLGPAQARLSVETINQIFLLSANPPTGTINGFKRKLQLAWELCSQGRLAFTADELAKYLKHYALKGYPPVSHSVRYKEAYFPSYQVVSSVYAHYYPLLEKIEGLLQEKGYVVVAIDGRAAAGKTTLARLLQDIYGCPIVSMDHFFLRPEQRTEERFQEPGGNVDYERFQAEVLPGLTSGESFSYRSYDCQTQSFSGIHFVGKARLRIVEGSYSLHPQLSRGWDLRVFLTIDPGEQKERILKRNGPVMLRRFLEEWIPLEEKYFAAYQIKTGSDLVFE